MFREDRSGRRGVRPLHLCSPGVPVWAGVGWVEGRARAPTPHTPLLEQPGSPGRGEERALSQAAAESRHRALVKIPFWKAVPFLEAESPGSDAVSPAEALAAPGGGAGSRAPSRPRRPGDAPFVRPGPRGKGFQPRPCKGSAQRAPRAGVASPHQREGRDLKCLRFLFLFC